MRDGDGVLFGDVEVRLRGIAAPEDNQKKREPGGPESTKKLRSIIGETKGNWWRATWTAQPRKGDQ